MKLMKNNQNQSVTLRHDWAKRTFAVVVTAISGLLLLIGHMGALKAQPAPLQAILSGTIHLYLVTDYGENIQEVDRYRKTGEGSMIAFILKTDKKINMTQYLDQEDLKALKDYSGETWQSEFMVVPD